MLVNKPSSPPRGTWPASIWSKIPSSAPEASADQPTPAAARAARHAPRSRSWSWSQQCPFVSGTPLLTQSIYTSSGVQLVISDQHSGLVAALRRVFQGAAHQRCRGHFVRNLLALVPKSHHSMAAAVFRTIFAQPDAATVTATWETVRDQLAAAFPRIGPLMDEAKAEVLAFTAFPRSHGPRSGQQIRWSG
jgi:hypothetical protein